IFRRAVGGDANGVMEIGDGIPGDHVAWAVNFNGIVAGEQVRTVSGYGPRVAARLALGAAPSEQAKAVVATQEEIVGDVESARARILCPHSKTDVLEATILHREADRAENFFLAGENSNVRVSKGEAVEDVIPRRHHVEEPMIAIAVDNHLPIAGSLDRDGLVGRAFQREGTGPIEWRHHRIDVIKAFGFIATGMEQENVTRLRAAFPDDRPVTQTGAVVGLQNAREARFLARAEIVRRVNMQSTAA